MDRISQWLWDANLAAAVVLLWRFTVLRVYRSNPLLFAFFAAMGVGGILLMQISYQSNLYAYLYIGLQLLSAALTLFTILELYRTALARHKGLADFGRTTLWVVTGGVALVALVSATLDSDVPKGQSIVIHRYLKVERTVDFVFILFLLVIAVFITWFPVRMSRNTALSIGGFTGYYVLRAISLLAANLTARANLPAINALNMGLSALLMLAWGAMLRSEEENVEVTPGHAWDPEALEGLTRQLDEINAALSRFGRN